MNEDLALRARGGDHDAFALIAARSIGRLTAAARLILRDPDRAEDAVQEALVHAWRDIRGLRDPERLDAWLHRLLVNACYEQARRDRRRAVREIAVSPIDEPSVADATHSTAMHDQLERGLRRLSQDQRAILVLAFYVDLPLADTARALEIPLGTAKSRLSRATQALRAVLDADEREPIAIQELTR